MSWSNGKPKTQTAPAFAGQVTLWSMDKRIRCCSLAQLTALESTEGCCSSGKPNAIHTTHVSDLALLVR